MEEMTVKKALDEPVYIVKINMASPLQIAKSKEIDEITEEKTYKFEKATRLRMATARSKVRRQMDEYMINFENLWLSTESNIKKLEQSVEDANSVLKEIDPSLYANIKIIPLDMVRIREMRVQEDIVLAIKSRVYDEVTERLKKLRESGITKKGNLNTKMVNTTIKMLEHIKEINVLDDVDVNSAIDNLKEQLTRAMSAELEDVDRHLNNIEKYVNNVFARVDME